jgi:hypothetical protein
MKKKIFTQSDPKVDLLIISNIYIKIRFKYIYLLLNSQTLLEMRTALPELETMRADDSAFISNILDMTRQCLRLTNLCYARYDVYLGTSKCRTMRSVIDYASALCRNVDNRP